MILVPEIKTVFLLVPRTGSGSLRRAIAAKFPRSMLLYRHMEADGVPAGYDTWRKVGFVREPVERLWSVYKFMRDFAGDHDPAYIASLRTSAAKPFDNWLVDNEIVFTSPYDRAGQGRFFAEFTVRHPLPENRKSQWLTLRPDLGTAVYPFEHLPAFARGLGLDLGAHNATVGKIHPPTLGAEALDYVRRVFAWDFATRRTLLERAA
ncbi:MAG TPA: hypothetical protein VGH15_05670 [Caulobacteraceae bacterium]